MNISNCSVSVRIHSSKSGDGTHGGLVANQHGALTVEGCIFAGRLLTTKGTTDCGGLVGYHSGGTCTISNCLYEPASFSTSESYINSGATFCRNYDGTPVNCYYSATLGDAQGKARHTVTAGEGVTISNIALTGSSQNYDVSGIRAYDNGGIKYNNTLYYGSGDQVSLTLSNDATGAPLGYQYGYSVSGGATLDGTTLTMADANVTVSVDTETLVPIDWATVSTGESEADPYIIYNNDQLDLLAHRVNGTHGETADADGFSSKYFVLGADITYSTEGIGATESNYTAIGGYYDSEQRDFCGHFDGKGHTVRGIRIYNPDSYNNQGLFGKTYLADIRGITLADTRITSLTSTGGIVGYNGGGTVSDCHVAADVTIAAAQSKADRHGGIVGHNDSGTISDCTSAATLTIDTNCENYGGIAGSNSGILHHNLAIGAIVPAAKSNFYGAICGYNYGTLQNNYYYACRVGSNDITASGVGCGGIRVDNIYKIDDVTNGAEPGIIIYDHSSNTDINSTILTVAVNNSEVEDEEYEDFVKVPRVALAGPTLYKDGAWNTLCLPFYLENIAGSVLDDDDVDVRCLYSSDFSGGTLMLTFTGPDDVICIENAIPYLIRWGTPESNPGTTLTDPVFTDVHIPSAYTTAEAITAAPTTASSKTDYVDFIGTFSPKGIYEDGTEKHNLYLGDGNNLYYPTAEDFQLNAFRAWFQLKNDLTAGDPSETPGAGGGSLVRAFNLNFGEEESQGISDNKRETINNKHDANAWYTLDGVKVGGVGAGVLGDLQSPVPARLRKGVYIHGGKKVVIP